MRWFGLNIEPNGCKHEQAGNAHSIPQHTALSARLLMFVVIGRNLLLINKFNQNESKINESVRHQRA